MSILGCNYIDNKLYLTETDIDVPSPALMEFVTSLEKVIDSIELSDKNILVSFFKTTCEGGILTIDFRSSNQLIIYNMPEPESYIRVDELVGDNAKLLANYISQIVVKLYESIREEYVDRPETHMTGRIDLYSRKVQIHNRVMKKKM